MKYDQFHRIVELNGWVAIRQSGSHVIYRRGEQTYPVPYHKGKELGAGDTIDAAKENMRQQMHFYRETAVTEGFKYPAFLDGEFEITYSIDVSSLMTYYVEAGIFSLAGLEKMTGISQKQLWAYLHGTRPRKAQSDRIESGLRSLYDDLNAIFA